MRRLVLALTLAAGVSGAAAFDPLGSRGELAAVAPPGQLPLDAGLVGGPACPGPLPAPAAGGTRYGHRSV